MHTIDSLDGKRLRSGSCGHLGRAPSQGSSSLGVFQQLCKFLLINLDTNVVAPVHWQMFASHAFISLMFKQFRNSPNWCIIILDIQLPHSSRIICWRRRSSSSLWHMSVNLRGIWLVLQSTDTRPLTLGWSVFPRWRRVWLHPRTVAT